MSQAESPRGAASQAGFGELMHRLILALSALLGGVILAPAASADVVRLRADPWCPFNCQPGATLPGYGVEIATAALAAAGHQVDYAIMPWARTLQETRRGRVDGALAVSKTEANPLGLILGPVMGYAQACFFAAKGSNWRFTGIESLKTRTLGVILGYGFGDKGLAKYVETNKADRNRIRFIGGETAVETNLDLLVKGRVTAIVENGDVIRYQIQHSGLGAKIAEAGCLEGRTRLYIGFSPANTSSVKYAADLDLGMKRLRDSGALRKILARYGLKDWQ
jgi:polar amino acid transport system substrate-binding protein